MFLLISNVNAEIVRLDESFNGVGYVVHNGAAGGNADDRGSSIAKQEDGKYVVVGISTNTSGDYDMTIWRYLVNGQLDTTFNSVGYITHNGAAGGNYNDVGYSIDIQNDGKYVVTGYSMNPSLIYDMTIWRYTKEGQLDTSFGGVGYVTHNGAAGGNGNDYGYSLAIQEDGKYIITGISNNSSGNYDMVIWRYTNEGQLDMNFNGIGYVVYDGGSGSDEGKNILLQDENHFLVIGLSANSSSNSDMMLWRYKNLYQTINVNNGLETKVGDVSIEEGGTEGVYGINEVTLYDEEELLAEIGIDMTEDRDFSEVRGGVSRDGYKAYIHNLTKVVGASSEYTMYVPYRLGDNAVGICPGAEEMSDVGVGCEGLIYMREGGISLVNIGGFKYWRIEGLRGTGAYSTYLEILADTGYVIYLPMIISSTVAVIVNLSKYKLNKIN